MKEQLLEMNRLQREKSANEKRQDLEKDLRAHRWMRDEHEQDMQLSRELNRSREEEECIV